MTAAAKVNLTAVKTTLAAMRENLVAAIKWREDKAEITWP